jgi:hypothetical protein
MTYLYLICGFVATSNDTDLFNDLRLFAKNEPNEIPNLSHLNNFQNAGIFIKKATNINRIDTCCSYLDKIFSTNLALSSPLIPGL